MDRQLCEHLDPIVKVMLTRGNAIDTVETGWSNAELVVTLRTREDLRELHQPLPACVEKWKSTDPHYPRQEGLFCTAHKHSVGWPLPKGQESS